MEQLTTEQLTSLNVIEIVRFYFPKFNNAEVAHFIRLYFDTFEPNKEGLNSKCIQVKEKELSN